MPLRVNIQNCSANSFPDEIDENTSYAAVLVHGLMLIDVGKVTVDNVSEILTRFRIAEEFGYFILADKRPMPAEYVIRWIGATTNIVTISRTKWINDFVRRLPTIPTDVRRVVTSVVRSARIAAAHDLTTAMTSRAA